LPKFDDPNLIVGAEGFSDAGVYRLRADLYIVQTLDFFPPLLDDPYVFGQIAAANSLSDVYAMGARPVTAMNIVAFPDNELELDVLAEILRGGAERVQAAGAVIVGGHTVRDAEIKYGLSVTGVVAPEKLLTNAGAKAGDVLALTKPLGTGYVTTAFKKGQCPEFALAAAAESMSQLNKAASEAAQAVGAHAVTDITGFGLVGHAGEMAQSSGVTVVLELDRLPMLPGALELAAGGFKNRANRSNQEFSAATARVEGTPNPWRLEIAYDAQTSGGLLVSLPREKAEDFVRLARGGGAPATCVVGEVQPRSEAAVVLRG
jgi:selenide,water dikinase